MRIEHFFYLQEIVKAKSFSNAADQLFISQQSLSEAVAKIEKEFNLKIFYRSRKGAQLTDKGEAFMADLDKLLIQYRYILQKYITDPCEDKNSLSVCTNNVVSSFFFEKILKRFHDIYPHVALTVVEEHSPSEVLRQVCALKADLGITSMPAFLYKPSARLPELVYQDLFMDYLCLMVPSNHPLAGRQSITLRECMELPLILDNNGVIKKDLLDYNGGTQFSSADFNIIMESSAQEIYINTILNGVAAGFITRLQFAKLKDPALAAIPLKKVDPLYFVAVSSVNFPLNTHMRNFINLFKSILEGIPSEYGGEDEKERNDD